MAETDDGLRALVRLARDVIPLLGEFPVSTLERARFLRRAHALCSSASTPADVATAQSIGDLIHRNEALTLEDERQYQVGLKLATLALCRRLKDPMCDHPTSQRVSVPVKRGTCPADEKWNLERCELCGFFRTIVIRADGERTESEWMVPFTGGE